MPNSNPVTDRCTTPPTMLFDGVCNLCNGAVQFMLKIERHDKLRFGTLQSSSARRMLSELNAPLDLSTVVYVENNNVYTHSTAISMLLRCHGRPVWAFLGNLLGWIPLPFRDFAYRYIAINRYKWFGQRDVCMVPTSALKERFLS